MGFRYRYKPKARSYRIDPRILKMVSIAAVFVVAMVGLVNVGPQLTGLVTAPIAESNCVDVLEPQTVTEAEEFTYSYQATDHIFEETSDGYRGFLVLENREGSSGRFQLEYTFSGGGKRVTQTSEKEIFGNDKAVFEFFLEDLAEGIEGSFEVNAPSETRMVEKQAFKTVQRCG